MTGLVPVTHVAEPPRGFKSGAEISASIGRRMRAAAWMTGTSPVMTARGALIQLVGLVSNAAIA
jgi:hypothetical protein